jgi:putative spermidine/putrescine transport system substrate-binding protein
LLLVATAHVSAKAADVICYNCPPQWADWASMLKSIKKDLGYDIPFDNKNSGQTLSQLIAEKSSSACICVTLLSRARRDV